MEDGKEANEVVLTRLNMERKVSFDLLRTGVKITLSYSPFM